ncbi:MAG TPA: hypothetical protein VFA46_03325 [Actinomycetes bacterium]|nr:hypothetical protein [Actinomycetes bacterium]
MNVLPARTAGDAAPSESQLRHGREQHLRLTLQELRPNDIIWRYVGAQNAAKLMKRELQGAWRTDLGMGGLVARTADRERINRELRVRRTR